MEPTAVTPADRPPTDAVETPSNLRTHVCRICFDEFPESATWPHAVVCSHRCRLRLWQLPHGHMWETVCAYCGDAADTEDHVPPRKARDSIVAMRERHLYPFFTVPACHECNCSILNGRQLWTIAERFDYVAKALPKRHADILAMPDWGEDEIDELGPNMRREVVRGLRIRARQRSRIEWAIARSDEGKLWTDLSKNTGSGADEVASILTEPD